MILLFWSLVFMVTLCGLAFTIFGTIVISDWGVRLAYYFLSLCFLGGFILSVVVLLDLSKKLSN